MTSLDDLRRDDDADHDDGMALDIDTILEARAAAQSEPVERKFLGMTAAERAFLSVMIFFCTLVIGAALLIATGRMVIG